MEAKTLSWKLLGTNFDGEVSINDAIEQAGLNYEVSASPLLRITPDMVHAIEHGEPLNHLFSQQDIITSHKATYRTDHNHTLGVVGEKYGIVQNTKAFEFINFIEEVSGTKPTIETAGALGYGERMFVTCRLGKDVYLNEKDAVSNYVVFTNTHDGSGAVMAFFTPIRVICQNSLNVAIRSCPNKIMFRHSKNVNTRLDWEIAANRQKALEVFSKSVDFSKHFIERMEQFKNEKLTSEQVYDLTAKMYLTDKQFAAYKQNGNNLFSVDEIPTRTQNQILAFRSAVENGVGQNEHRGTKLWLLNGITTLLHNERKWKTPQDEFNSLMEGDGLKKTQKMYDLLLAA